MREVRILWLETGDLYTVNRAKEAGARLGIQLDSLDAYDISFVADGRQIGAFAQGRDLSAYYDALVVRSFLPLLSESLTLARLFRDAGKPVVDESMTDEAYAISKMHDYLVLASNGVAVPRTRQFCDVNDMAAFASEVGYPCVVKGTHGSQGRHVHKVESERQLRKKLLQYRPGEAVIQEYLDAPIDYRVIVVGYQALPVYVSRKPKADEFRTNFEHNEVVLSHPLSDAPQLQDIAERAARCLRREFTGVDIRCRGNVPLVLEANRRPGYKGFEEVTGFDVAGAFVSYVASKCRRPRAAPLTAHLTENPPTP